MNHRRVGYALRARDQYNIDNNKYEFIKAVWLKIQTYAKTKEVVENSTRIMLDLTKMACLNSDNLWIGGKVIRKKLGHYAHDKSYGLWPWLEITGAGIILERGQWPQTEYKIKDEFYETLKKIV